MENTQLGSAPKTVERPKRTPDTRRARAAAGAAAPPGGVSPVSRACARARAAVVAPAEPAEDAEPIEQPAPWKAYGGSDQQAWNSSVVRATMACVNSDSDEQDRRVEVACVGLAAFKPANEVEAMIAAQALALHEAAMMCLGRAARAGQPFDVASKLRRDGANLARGMTDMLDALDRKRGKTQVVRVERVVVNDGGQAIVGTVAAAAAVPGGQGG